MILDIFDFLNLAVTVSQSSCQLKLWFASRSLKSETVSEDTLVLVFREKASIYPHGAYQILE